MTSNIEDHLLAYQISAEDNDSYMFSSDFVTPRCEVCGVVLDFEVINPRFRVNRRGFDCSYTYDGRCIVSEKFKRFCESRDLQELVFAPLPSDEEFFSFRANREIDFDIEVRKTQFSAFCDRCRRFRYVAGATPVFLRNADQILDHGIFSTDIQFGSDDAKHPLLLVGLATAKELKSAGMKGIYLRPVTARK